MICYSVQPRDGIFVKCYGFLSFAKHTVRRFLIMLNILLQMHLKLHQKERFKKQQKQLVV